MAQARAPRIWNAYVVPTALAVFYFVVLCRGYSHLASMFPNHFNAAGNPGHWTSTGTILSLSIFAIALIYLVFGISLIYSAEKRRAWWVVGIIFAGAIGATVGASVEFIQAVHAFRAFHSFTWIAWGVIAAIAEALFLLIPRGPASDVADSMEP